MQKLFFIPLLLSVSFSNLHAQKKTYHSKDTKAGTFAKKSIIKYGTASFYAKKFNGRKTANGDIYNSTKNTAACNVLPLNTWIKVTNLKNNRSVIVRINDRLHAKSKRLVDLSKNAAQELKYIGRGVTRVRVEVLPDYQLSARS
jgi:rare lipoprotein A